MSYSAENGEQRGEVITSGLPRWLAVLLIFMAGCGAGAVAIGLHSSERPGDILDGAHLVGCGAEVTLVLSADGLPDSPHELRASLGASDRVLPLISSMTLPLVGAHQGHQSLVPEHGRLVVVAHVPLGQGQPLRYELVASSSEVVMSGTLQPATCE